MISNSSSSHNRTLQPQTLRIQASVRRKTIEYDAIFQIARNSVTLLIGQSGCGKTTMLRDLSGTALPSMEVSSEISNLTDNISKRNNIEYLPQCDNLLFHYKKHTVLQILDIFSLAASGKNILESQFESLMNQVVMNKSIQDRLYGELSGGERMRVRLATILLSQKPIWILDEVK